MKIQLKHDTHPIVRRLVQRLAAGAVVAGLASTGAGCAAGNTPPAGEPALTIGQLSTALEGGPLRVEVTLRADGSVREVEIEDEGPGHEAELEGRVVAADAASRQLTIEHLGTVDASAVTRFRSESESNWDETAFWGNLEASLKAGTAVWVDARGRLGEAAFLANELRLEDDTKTQLEVDIDATALDLSAGVLRVGWLELDLGGARIQYDDGDDAGDDDLNDDSDDDGEDDDSDDDGDDADDDDGDDTSDDDDSDDDGDDTSDDDGADDGTEDPADDGTDDGV